MVGMVDLWEFRALAGSWYLSWVDIYRGYDHLSTCPTTQAASCRVLHSACSHGILMTILLLTVQLAEGIDGLHAGSPATSDPPCHGLIKLDL